jgi:ankyrin repeat protein
MVVFGRFCRAGELSALLDAASSDYSLKVVMLLAVKGIDPMPTFTDGTTPLHFACINANKQIVQALLLKDVDVNAISFDRETALMSLMRNLDGEKRIEILRLLLADERIDPEMVDSHGHTALDAVEQSRWEPEIKALAVKLLRDAVLKKQWAKRLRARLY